MNVIICLRIAVDSDKGRWRRDSQISRRTLETSSYLRRGVAKRVLEHIIDEAKRRGYERVSLETGSQEAFEPARKLYQSFEFEFCNPFADYILDPNSVFMTLTL